MRIAVASNGLDIAPSFSQCENFNYYTTKSYEIVASQNFPAQGLAAEEYASVMEDMGVNAIICDQIGALARNAFESRDIKVVDSKQGNALAAAQELIEAMAEALVNEEAEDDDE